MKKSTEIVYIEPSESPGTQLWRASNAFLRAIRKAIEPTGMSHAQMILLANLDYLNQREPSVTQRKLCRFSTMDENMVSQVVRSLIRKGWAERKPDPTDKRAYILVVTEEGRDRLSEALALARPATQSFFAPLGEERPRLTQLLRTLNEA